MRVADWRPREVSLFQTVPSLFRVRFRSASRDMLSDERRLGWIRKSIQAAIDDTERERDGLQRRLKDAVDKAAFLFGSELDSEARLDAKASADLRRAEKAITDGQNRLAALEKEVARLRNLKTRLYDI
jgi:hypothetical protein